MAGDADRIELLQTGPMMPMIEAQLASRFLVHRLDADDAEAVLSEAGPRIRAVATGVGATGNGKRRVTRELLARLPKVEIVANFGVGYDAVDVVAAAERGIDRHQYARRARRRRRRPHRRAAARHHPPIAAGRALSARRQVAAAVPSRSPRRCATVPSASSAWAASARRSRRRLVGFGRPDRLSQPPAGPRRALSLLWRARWRWRARWTC